MASSAVAAAKEDSLAAADKMEALHQARCEANERLAVLSAEFTTYKALTQNPTQVINPKRCKCLTSGPFSGFGFRVSGFGFRVSGFGFRVWGLG